MFEIRFGIPEMLNLWNDLNSKIKSNTASKDEIKFHKS